MARAASPLYDCLIACAVRIVIRPAGAGSGSFVAPGRVLTCKHVAYGKDGQPAACEVHFDGKVYPARPAGVSDTDDLALLEIDRKDHPCVLVQDAANPRDPVYLWGYPAREDMVRGESVTGFCEGRVVEDAGGVSSRLIKFTPGGVRPGMSGAALLNESTGGVCGVVKRTRDSQIDMGGFAVPADRVWAAFPGLREENERYHADHPEWARAAQAHQQAPGSSARPSSRVGAQMAEFATLIDDRTELFVGRGFLIKRIDDATSAADVRSGYVLVTGEPGVGKTALLAYLAKTRGHVHHFNVASLGIVSPRQFVDDITAQLGDKYGLVPSDPPADVSKSGVYLAQVLREAAKKRGDARIVILVDALDEASDEQLPAGANRLFLPRELPEGVFVVATSRPLVSYRLVVNTLERIPLDENGEENLKDVRQFVLEFLARHEARMKQAVSAWGTSEGDFADAIVKRSAGNFMYVKHVLRDIRDGLIDHQTIDSVWELPAGLVEYYSLHWEGAKRKDPERFERITRPVVCMLATAKRPVTKELVVQWTHARWPQIRIEDIRAVVDDWRPFLDEVREPGAPPAYRIYHASFQDFLREREGLGAMADMIIDTAIEGIPGFRTP
jgi:S1-C subfamily serine protease